ncbi:MAG: O-antigen ligase family protein [Thermovirgaceae bacterium]
MDSKRQCSWFDGNVPKSLDSLSDGKEFVPFGLYFGVLFIALTLPNIAFSGLGWFQTLHLLKWFFAFVPVGVLAVFAGCQLAKFGAKRTGFALDSFGAVWLSLLLFLTLQPLWAPLTSVPTFVREWLFFASLWVVYVLVRYKGTGKLLEMLIIGAALNAFANTLFAELQIRDLNGLFPFILPTPGKYIGNTGQQNMFALWVSMGLLGTVFVMLQRGLPVKRGQTDMVAVLNSILLAGLSWGLWNSTSRSGFLSFVTGWVILALVYGRQGFGLDRRIFWKRNVAVFLVLLATFFASYAFGRGNIFLAKYGQMLSEPEAVGNRDSIWATSYTMFRMHPLSGVGLGHYKWNYLEAQKEMLRRWPGKEWKFTLWAHNEVLQWFCETGVVGGMIFILFGIWWLRSFWGVLSGRIRVDPETAWACGMLFLLWFNAMWTRPFHRIENALWMAFAFALANRKMLSTGSEWTELRREWIARLFGVSMATVALAGLVFFASGMYGDRQLRYAVETTEATSQLEHLERARRHLMVSDLAERQIAYHFIARARATGSAEYLVEGINRLHAYFRTEPQSRELHHLLGWYRRLEEKELYKSVAEYLHPRTSSDSVIFPPSGEFGLESP